jgi:hypothetical protein
MLRGDVECVWCGAWYRRIEVASIKGKPGEYSCLLCNQPLESFSGETLIVYRLDIERSTTLKRSRAKPGLSGQDRVNADRDAGRAQRNRQAVRGQQPHSTNPDRTRLFLSYGPLNINGRE